MAVVAVVVAVVAVLIVGRRGAGKAMVHPPAAAPPASQPAGQPLPDSMFGRRVDGLRQAANSTQLVGNLVSQIHSHYGAVAVNGMPLFTVGPSQPMVTVAVTQGCNDFASSVGQVPIPANAYTTDPHYQHDSAMVVYQPSSHTAWELWRAQRSAAGSWFACAGGRLNTATSDGVFPSPTGLSATGISYLATMITESDVQSGAIGHALALDLTACNYYTAPAVRGDCGSDPGQPPEGTLFRLPADLAMPSGLTPFGALVFRALQTYGAVATDQAGAVAIQAESGSDWTAEGHHGTDPLTSSWAGKPEYAVLDGIPWQNLQVVTPPAAP